VIGDEPANTKCDPDLAEETLWQPAPARWGAKAEPGFRFYILYDKVWRTGILGHAYDLARANGGASGVDGATFEQIETAELEDWLTRLNEELQTKMYRCQPVRRVMIPKPGGGERLLGIPTIRDRVVQTAGKLVLEPIFEADLDAAAHGYRPNRGAGQAIQTVLALLRLPLRRRGAGLYRRGRFRSEQVFQHHPARCSHWLAALSIPTCCG
jgi:hypothetical protein